MPTEENENLTEQNITVQDTSADIEEEASPTTQSGEFVSAEKADEVSEPDLKNGEFVNYEQPQQEQEITLTREEEKKKAFTYLIFAGITLALVYFAQIFRLLAPLFDRVYYGNLTTMFFYIACVVFWIPCIILLNIYVKKFGGYRVFRKNKKELPLSRSLIIYACAVVPIFIVSAALGFELKIVFELGKRVTAMQLSTNAVMYAYGAVKLILGVFIIELVQEAIELLYKGKYSKLVPWGGIALMLTFGIADLLIAYFTGGYVLFAWLYIAFDLLYGVIYLLAKKSFGITFAVSLIIYIL